MSTCNFMIGTQTAQTEHRPAKESTRKQTAPKGMGKHLGGVVRVLVLGSGGAGDAFQQRHQHVRRQAVLLLLRCSPHYLCLCNTKVPPISMRHQLTRNMSYRPDVCAALLPSGVHI